MKPKLTMLSLVAITFFLVSGGPHGLEEMIAQLGYGLSMVALLVVPIIWALPISFVVAELASAISAEGGFYVWTNRALGTGMGFIQAWVAMAASIFDMGLYPNLFWESFKFILPPEFLARFGTSDAPRLAVGAMVVLGGVGVNLRGTRMVGKVSERLALLLLSPFLLLIVFVVAKFLGSVIAEGKLPVLPVQMSALTMHDAWAGLLVVLWNYMGWENASTIASEVHQPQRTYPKAMFITVALVAINYLLPVGAMALTGIPHTEWKTGYWVVVGGQYGGFLLKLSIALGGMFSAFGMFNDLVMTYARIPVALARNGWLPEWFKPKSQDHPPTVAILVCAVFWMCSLKLGFSKLIGIDLMLNGLSIALLLLSFLVLRVREPSPGLQRPFQIPGGLPVAVMVVVLPTALIVGALRFNAREAFLGMNQLLFGGLVILAGAVVYNIPMVRDFLRSLAKRFAVSS